MNLKHKEHSLTEIRDFDYKMLMYAEIIGFMCDLEKGLCSSRAQNFIDRQGLIISSYIERTYF